MTEAEPARHLGCPHEVAREQLVEGRHGSLFFHRRRRRGQLGLERVARHGGAIQEVARGWGQEAELLGERHDHRGRHLHSGEALRRGGTRARRLLRGAGELLQEERVAAALGVEHLCRVLVEVGAEELRRVLLREAAQLQARERPGAVAALERGRQPVGKLPRARGEREQHRRRGRAAEQRADQLDRRRVGPVDVVEDQHQRLRRREPLEQLPDRAVGAVALVLERDLARLGVLGERWQDARQLRPHVVLDRLEAARLEGADVLVERVHEDPEREVDLELRGTPGEDDLAGVVGERGELGDQPRLADSRLSEDRQRRRSRVRQPAHSTVQRVDFIDSSDELLGDRGHCESPRRA